MLTLRMLTVQILFIIYTSIPFKEQITLKQLHVFVEYIITKNYLVLKKNID